MKTVFALLLAFGMSAQAQTMKMYFDNEDLTKIISEYSKMSGQKFVVDPSVRGKISIFVQEPVSKEEAFNHLSTALMINGYAITMQNGVAVVRTARNAQRDLIDVVTELPPVAPAKMITWVYTPKHVAAQDILRELRMLASKDGEMSINPSTNSLVFSDYTPNLHRVAAILKAVDKPVDKATAKIVDQARQREEHFHRMHARKGGPGPGAPIPPEMNDGAEMPPPPPQKKGK